MPKRKRNLLGGLKPLPPKEEVDPGWVKVSRSVYNKVIGHFNGFDEVEYNASDVYAPIVHLSNGEPAAKQRIKEDHTGEYYISASVWERYQNRLGGAQTDRPPPGGEALRYPVSGTVTGRMSSSIPRIQSEGRILRSRPRMSDIRYGRVTQEPIPDCNICGNTGIMIVGDMNGERQGPCPAVGCVRRDHIYGVPQSQSPTRGPVRCLRDNQVCVGAQCEQDGVCHGGRLDDLEQATLALLASTDRNVTPTPEIQNPGASHQCRDNSRPCRYPDDCDANGCAHSTGTPGPRMIDNPGALQICNDCMTSLYCNRLGRCVNQGPSTD